jgi:hypothetical protein
MAALVGEGGIQAETRLGVNARLGRRRLKNGQEKTLGLRMCDCAGCLTLFTAYAAFGMYENRFHNLFLSSSIVKKIGRAIGPQHTSFPNSIPSARNIKQRAAPFLILSIDIIELQFN